MKTITANVKSGKKVVSSLDIQQADTMEEAVELYGGEENVIQLANRMYATDQKNAERAKFNRVPGKMQRLREAFALITPSELAECAGDSAAIEALIAKKAQELYPSA